jgi:prepilin-type N-terminal cleavage/methylation domain-containing protein
MPGEFLKRKKGFSLIEVVAVVGILAVFLGGTTMILTTAQKVNVESSYREQAHRYASEAIFSVKNYIEKKKEESAKSTERSDTLWLGDLQNLGDTTSFVIDEDKVYPFSSPSGDCGKFLPLSSEITFGSDSLSSGCFRTRGITSLGVTFKEYLRIERLESDGMKDEIVKNTLDEEGNKITALSGKLFVVRVTAFVTWQKEKENLPSVKTAENYVKAVVILTNHDFK